MLQVPHSSSELLLRLPFLALLHTAFPCCVLYCPEPLQGSFPSCPLASPGRFHYSCPIASPERFPYSYPIACPACFPSSALRLRELTILPRVSEPRCARPPQQEGASGTKLRMLLILSTAASRSAPARAHIRACRPAGCGRRRGSIRSPGRCRRLPASRTPGRLRRHAS